MPPKPWLTKANNPIRQDVSAMIQSQPTIKQQIPKINIQDNSINQNNNTGNTTGGIQQQSNFTGTQNMLGTSGYGSSGYGSSYGSSGYGSSYGSGYGSSYGMGMGGYGSSYGSMGGYGGMGSYGRYGMMGNNNDPNNPQGFMMNTLMTLESFGFLIQSFCEIGRSLDQNIEGLSHFFSAFTNLFKKIYNGIKYGCSWMGDKTRKSILSVMDFIKTYVLFQNKEERGGKIQALRIVMNVCIVGLLLSLYPLARRALAKTD